MGGPVKEKESSDGSARQHGLYYGVSCMQGWRESMEDAHIIVPSLGSTCAPMLSLEAGKKWRDTALFGVMDGHGGPHVARFCKRYLPEEIAKGPGEDISKALHDAFRRMDTMLQDPATVDELRALSGSMRGIAQGGLKSWFAHPNAIGSTAVICCVRPDEIIVANCGDSRAVLCNKGKALDMSEDHKPNQPTERERIMRAGGTVVAQRVGAITQYRVNGGLNLSRSIGDLAYKANPMLSPQEQMIICTPDIRRFKRSAGDEFMLICCDGVWDVLRSQECVDYVRERLGNLADAQQRLHSGSLRLSAILEDMLDHCVSPDLLATRGLGGDNMTAILVVFVGHSTFVSGDFSDRRIEPTHIEHVLPASSWLCAGC